MKQHKHRYLGPARYPQWLLRLLPFSLRFDDAAKLHDDAYFIGGSEVDRLQADENIYKNMKKVCGYNVFAYVFCDLYYCSVYIFGGYFFNYTE